MINTISSGEDGLQVHVAVTSHARPHNVPKIQEVLGVTPTFFVIEGEEEAYTEAGAVRVVGCRPGISAARNAALIEADLIGLPSVHISDDLKKIERIRMEDDKRVTEPATFKEIVLLMYQELRTNGYRYGGVAVNSNPLNYTGENISYNKLIVCDLNMFMPGIRFDEALPQKEDYDLTIRELIEVGGVVRLNNYLCHFPHRENEGGANTYRNEESEAKATALLVNKWPGLLKTHATRAGQVSLDYKAIEQYKNGQRLKLF